MSTKKYKILVVDDEKNIRRSTQLILENSGYSVALFQEALKAYEALRNEPFDLAFIDVMMEDISGIDLYRKMITEQIEVPVVFMSGNASLSQAVEAVNLGAFDFLEKPFTADKLLITAQRCLDHYAAKKNLDSPLPNGLSAEILGKTPQIQKILKNIEKVSNSAATVLINGESGTGKELIAKQIHEMSARHTNPFVKVNCSAIPETLIESELFGYEKGAFTGAIGSKKGYFEQAHRGTLFLDEIGDMALSAQSKVLRAIQNAEIQKVGSEKVIPIDVRIIAATHKNLKKEVAKGSFREDLYYRINVVPFQTVALRDHLEDLPLLVNTFLEKFCQKNGSPCKKIDSQVMGHLKRYTWPGNVRELQNLIERLVIMSGDCIREMDLPDYVVDRPMATQNHSPSLTLKQFKDHVEREYIISVLKDREGNVSQAARVLSIERTYLHKKIQQHRIEKREYFV